MQNQIPKNWQKVKLGEVVDITSSKRIFAHEYLKTGIPFYRGKEVIEKYNGRKISTDLFISPNKYEEIKTKFGAPSHGDMLLTSVGTLGIPYLVKEDERFYFKDGNLTWFRNHDGIDNIFLYYWIQSPSGKEGLLKHTIGSSQQALTIDGLKKIEINLPSLRLQKQISSILSAFDDKIELNNKIAKILEEMAQVLFKEWFVNKKKNNWEEKDLVQLLMLKHGFAFKSEQFTTHKTKNIVVRMGNFQENGGLQFSDNTLYLNDAENYKKYILTPGDLVMILSDITREGRLIGKVGIIPEDENIYVLNQRVAKIETNQEYKHLLYILFNSKLFHQHCMARADSATVLNLKNEHIYKYRMAIPDNAVLYKFNDLAGPILMKIESVRLENQKLAGLRDLLLPKLMRGEVRV